MKSKAVLPIIVIAQFACTSLWFAGNAVVTDIIHQFHLATNALGFITSAVQLGFIIGTLLFAIYKISDRFSPSKVFLVCAIAGAISNLAMFYAGGLSSILLSRFITGFFLAGIYPVGMKIASDYSNKGLGKALGYLVGALVLGTASPHLLKAFTATLSWTYVIAITSILAVAGGLAIGIFVPDGPYRSTAATIKGKVFSGMFKNKEFKAAAFGYFGHMWELYTFWAFVPVLLLQYKTAFKATYNVSLLSFLIIALGAVGCVAGGYIAMSVGSAKTAFTALSISLVCCLLSPVLFHVSFGILMVVLVTWALAVVADSPQFSTLVAQFAPANIKGTALTLVNSIGFFITIISIQCLSFIATIINLQYIFIFLAIGPAIGLINMRPMINKAAIRSAS